MAWQRHQADDRLVGVRHAERAAVDPHAQRDAAAATSANGTIQRAPASDRWRVDACAVSPGSGPRGA